VDRNEIVSRPTVLFPGPFHPPSNYPLGPRTKFLAKEDDSSALTEDAISHSHAMMIRPSENEAYLGVSHSDDRVQSNIPSTNPKVPTNVVDGKNNPLRNALKRQSLTGQPVESQLPFWSPEKINARRKTAHELSVYEQVRD
jgi:hypothetical protein